VTRKTSKYSRKRAAGHTYNGAQFLNIIDRCRPYTDDPIIGGIVKDGTAGIANKAELLTREAARDLIEHNQTVDPERAFDLLSHALGVSVIRAIQIEPVEEKNPALPILKAGTEAVQRSIARYQRDGSWGMDARGKIELAEAIEIYAQILHSSSPAQMAKATDERIRIIQGMYARHQKNEGAAA
jgi:hypothetical protein